MAALADSGLRKDDVVGTATVSSRVAMRRADDDKEEAEGMMAEGENAEVLVAARRTNETAEAAMESFIPFLCAVLRIYLYARCAFDVL